MSNDRPTIEYFSSSILSPNSLYRCVIKTTALVFLALMTPYGVAAPSATTTRSSDPTEEIDIYLEGEMVCKEIGEKDDPSRKSCEWFVKKKPGYYRLHRLKNYDSITKEMLKHNTIYLIPTGGIYLDGTVPVKDVKNVAFIGQSTHWGQVSNLHPPENSRTQDILSFENCQHCMLSNVVPIPTHENSKGRRQYFKALVTRGDKTTVIARDIDFRYFNPNGYLEYVDAAAVKLKNIKAEFNPDLHVDEIPYLEASAILLHSCDNVDAEDIRIFNQDPRYANERDSHVFLLDIIDPINFRFKNIMMMLHADTDLAQHINYIGVAFSNMERYKSKTVKGRIEGLITDYNDDLDGYWPEGWHSVSLSHIRREGRANNNPNAVSGSIDIVDFTAPDLAKNPVIKGASLFENLKITVTETERPEPSAETSTDWSNYSSTAVSLHQKGSNRSSSGWKDWMVIPVTVGTLLLVSLPFIDRYHSGGKSRIAAGCREVYYYCACNNKVYYAHTIDFTQHEESGGDDTTDAEGVIDL